MIIHSGGPLGWWATRTPFPLATLATVPPIPDMRLGTMKEVRGGMGYSVIGDLPIGKGHEADGYKTNLL